MDCIFCKIIAGAIPAEKLYEDDNCLVIKDIHPKATTHVLLIPKRHIESLAQLSEKDSELAAHLMLQLPQIAQGLGLKNGFRTVINTGKGGGQEVFHLHLHILGEPSLSRF